MISTDEADAVADTPISFKEFLETTPPNTLRAISDLCADWGFGPDGEPHARAAKPVLYLHCPVCEGPRAFRQLRGGAELNAGENYVYVEFCCSNCDLEEKLFALIIHWDVEANAHCLKLGERPTFGPTTPARLVTLIGGDRDAFLKGRRAESQGLGIGAFAYYRRVVESQKDRIVSKIIAVSQRLNASASTIERLEKAKAETQFTTAIELVAETLPQTLMINGHNPLTLLHKALSEGLHAKTDAECLELAQEIRLVLGGLAERISTALADDTELNDAVTRLLTRNSPKVE